MNLIKHLRRQRKFSFNTFGPGERTEGILDHIRKELKEIEEAPADLEEWIDVVMLALDGAWRAGYTPLEIANALANKQKKNEARNWPDWRTAEPGKAIEHVRGGQNMRDLVMRFLELPSSQKREISLKLGIIVNADIKVSEAERYRGALVQAKEKGLLEQLAKEIEHVSGDS